MLSYERLTCGTHVSVIGEEGSGLVPVHLPETVEPGSIGPTHQSNDTSTVVPRSDKASVPIHPMPHLHEASEQ